MRDDIHDPWYTFHNKASTEKLVDMLWRSMEINWSDHLFQMHHVYSVVYLSNLYMLMSILLYNRELIFAVSSYLPGNFGVVHKGVLKTDGNVVDVAVKTIKSEMFVWSVLSWVWIWIDISWLYLWYKSYAQSKCLVWSALNIAVDKIDI